MRDQDEGAVDEVNDSALGCANGSTPAFFARSSPRRNTNSRAHRRWAWVSARSHVGSLWRNPDPDGEDPDRERPL